MIGGTYQEVKNAPPLITYGSPAKLDSFRLTTQANRSAYQAGAFVRFPVDFVYLQAAISGSMMPTEYEVFDFQTEKSEKFKVNTWNIHVPIALGLRFGPIRAHAGVTGSLFIGQSSSRNYLDQVFETAMMAGFIGGGLDIWKFVLDFRMETPLGRGIGTYRDVITYKDITHDYEYTTKIYTVTLGYRLQPTNRKLRKMME
jgi:hypothetical protein